MQVPVSSRFFRRVALLAAGFALSAPAWAFDMGQLMQNMGQYKERTGRFVETKHMKVLDKPLRSTGEVRYVAPQLFEKKTVEPTAELLRVDGDALRVERGGKTYNVRLSSQPQAAAFVDVIVGLLTGDAGKLERSYDYELKGTAKKWTLAMVPKDAKMKSIISTVVASGDREQVRTIEYQQADGDRSVMVIEPLDKR